MNVPGELRQFRLLHRDFLFRMVDLELLSAHGDIQKLLGQFGALLGAFSFVLAIVSVPPFAFSKLPPERLAIALARTLLAQYQTDRADRSLGEALGLLERLLQGAPALR